MGRGRENPENAARPLFYEGVDAKVTHRLSEKCRRGELDKTPPNGRESFLHNLEDTSQENLIAGFLKCSVCGQMAISVQEAVRFAKHCESADDWIKFLIGWQQLFGGCRHESDAAN